MEIILWFALIAKMNDAQLTVAQRNDACFALRGITAPFVVAASQKELADPKVRTCAGTNLRKAGAVAELKAALASDDFEIRALAVRELGGFERVDLLPVIAAATRDSQLIVGVNAIEGLANYRDAAVVPYLLEIAKGGGLIGGAALDRAVTFHDSRVPGVARAVLARNDISDKLAAMRALAEMGDADDIPALQEIARKETEMVTAGRGFGLMPAISLSRAAKTTIERIESRSAGKDAGQ
jgi:HEAT repeat protein